jgi:hypothetical protein
MNAVHPTMRQALADCLPPGFRQAPAMRAISRLDAQISAQASTIAALRAQAQHQEVRIDILRAALRNCNAPACPADQFAHTYQHPELGELECHLYGEEGEPEYGMEDLVELRAAYLHGTDIADRLTNDEAARIEIAACAALAEAQMEF